MKKLAVLASLVALLGAAALPAQKMGMVNNSAPTVSSSIAFGDKLTLDVKCTAITWAKGRMMERLGDAEKGEKSRESINATAEKAPLGEFKASADCTLGGKKVAAGTYAMYFQIDKELKWHLVLAKDQAKIDWPLDLKDAAAAQTRLTVHLSAGDKDDTATLTIQFGKLSCSVPATPGAA